MVTYEPFTIIRPTLELCKQRANELYGVEYEILQKNYIERPVFFGLFKKNECKIIGYPKPKPDMSKFATKIYGLKQKQPDLPEASENLFSNEKEKFLSLAQEHTGTDPKTTQILAELSKINEKIESLQPSAAENEHINICRINELLEQNDFLPAFRKKITDRLKKEIPYETLNNFYELEQQTLEWIAGEIKIYEQERRFKSPHIIVLVGPTGVGKTTTAGKLAALYFFDKERRFKPGLITIDQFRIGGVAQLSQYAEILEIPFATATTADELNLKLTLMKENADVIIVDTIGRSPRDSIELAEMKEILESCGSRAECFLTVSAATKALDFVSIAKQFEIFNYCSVIVTKLDETMHAGNVISVLAEMGKSIAFLADGQTATTDYLKKADPIRLLINLDGFEVNRSRLEKMFPPRNLTRTTKGV